MGETATGTICVNGIEEALEGRTIRALLDMRGVDAEGRGFAVALNGSVVPRSAWVDTMLRADDTVEIVQAKQGG